MPSAGYKLRETDNRLNRMKNRTKTPTKTETLSVPSECGSDSNSRCSSLAGEGKVNTNPHSSNAATPLSIRELRQKGLTKYDAEMLIAQGCKFSDIVSDDSKILSFKSRSEQVIKEPDRESRLNARNLRKSKCRRQDMDEGGGTPEAPPIDMASENTCRMSLRNHKRLSEPILDTSLIMREKINNNNNQSDICPKQEEDKLIHSVECKVKRTEVSKKENEKIEFVNRVSNRRKSVFSKVNNVLEHLYSPVCRPKRTPRCLRYNGFNSSTQGTSEFSLESESKLVESKYSSCSSDMLDVIKQEFVEDSKEDVKKELGLLGTKDIYEFDDQEYEASEPGSFRRVKVEDKIEADYLKPVKTEPTSEPSTPEKQSTGRLKLTLRVKRSPVVEESSHLRENWSTEVAQYEILRWEGDIEEDLHRRKKHKNKDRERRRRKREYSNCEDSSQYPVSEIQLPMKRLKLILGNESQTINLPQMVMS